MTQGRRTQIGGVNGLACMRNRNGSAGRMDNQRAMGVVMSAVTGQVLATLDEFAHRIELVARVAGRRRVRDSSATKSKAAHTTMTVQVTGCTQGAGVSLCSIERMSTLKRSGAPRLSWPQTGTQLPHQFRKHLRGAFDVRLQPARQP